MYEKSTGNLLLRIEQLEAENMSLQRQIIDAMMDRDVARASLDRERRECDEQARLVMTFAQRYESERALLEALAKALLDGPFRGTSDVRQERMYGSDWEATHRALTAYEEARRG